MSNKLAAATKLDPANAVYLPIDYMHGLMAACRSIDPGAVRNNAIALTKVARLFGLPTFGTGDRSGRTYLGAEMKEIEELVPGMRFFNRSSVGAWDAPGYADAVRATGRKQLIMAGITTEQCVTFTAQSALAEGFQVYVVLDASASLDERAETAAIARLSAMGAVLTTWSPLAAELLGDFAKPEGAGLIKIYFARALLAANNSDNDREAVRNLELASQQEAGSFDRILVNGSLRDVPATLIERLNPGGRLVGAIGTPAGPRLVAIAQEADGPWRQVRETPLRIAPLTPGLAAVL